ncbi:MAG: hypothetical protein R3F53_02455 [Gammaproteobacteria bacterium]
MQFSAIARILGLLLLLFSVSLLPPIAVSWSYQDGEARYFLYTLGGLLGVGLLSRLLVPSSTDLRTRDGFPIVTLFRAGLGFPPVVSAAHFSPTPHLSYTDATFEALSGLSIRVPPGTAADRNPTAVVTVLPSATAVAGRYGHDCAGSRGAADAGSGR